MLIVSKMNRGVVVESEMKDRKRGYVARTDDMLSKSAHGQGGDHTL